LVVDDFEDWRHFVSSILEKTPNWHVVCEVSDGLEAVKKAQELKPDLILLDISLPKLNGIEAARQIRKLAPNSTILFLSANDDMDIAGEALNVGASGYVVKSDARSELLSAVQAAIQGKRFVSNRLRRGIAEHAKASDCRGGNEPLASPSAVPRRTEVTRCHEVQFYCDDEVLLERVTHFIFSAVHAGNPAIVIATRPHRDNLVQRLKAQGVDVDAAIRRGAYVSLDAADTLSTLMVDDWPDEVRFFEGFSKRIESASKAAMTEHPRVAIFGEAVALLCAEGKRNAAIRLEQLGNELVKTHNVDILCAYPFSSFHGEEDGRAFKKICAEHSAVHSLQLGA
jgi:DNA-binding NarL/FixJ family response regulator